jgi:hypothetical protein
LRFILLILDYSPSGEKVESTLMSPRTELNLYGKPAMPPERPRWRPQWLEEFEAWAAPPVAPEREEEQERSFVPVGVLLGIAIVVQYAQLGIGPVREFLLDGNPLERPAWMGFTMAKQWILFVLVLLVLRMREEGLTSIGFSSSGWRWYGRRARPPIPGWCRASRPSGCCWWRWR